MSARKFKLDIIRTVEAADLKRRDFYAKLSDEERKGFIPYTALRWFSGLRGNGDVAAYYVQATNERINRDFWLLKDHPELVWLLMCGVGLGSRQQHQWIEMPKVKRDNNRLSEFLRRFRPGLNDLEIEILLNQYTHETFSEFVLASGVSDAEADALIKEFGKRNASAA